MAKDKWSYHPLSKSLTQHGFLVIADRLSAAGQPWTFVTNDTELPTTVSPRRYLTERIKYVTSVNKGDQKGLKDVSVHVCHDEISTFLIPANRSRYTIPIIATHVEFTSRPL